jgi:hypothetical protein
MIFERKAHTRTVNGREIPVKESRIKKETIRTAVNTGLTLGAIGSLSYLAYRGRNIPGKISSTIDNISSLANDARKKLETVDVDSINDTLQRMQKVAQNTETITEQWKKLDVDKINKLRDDTDLLLKKANAIDVNAVNNTVNNLGIASKNISNTTNELRPVIHSTLGDIKSASDILNSSTRNLEQNTLVFLDSTNQNIRNTTSQLNSTAQDITKNTQELSSTLQYIQESIGKLPFIKPKANQTKRTIFQRMQDNIGNTDYNSNLTLSSFMISQNDYARKKRQMIQSYGGYRANRQVMQDHGWTSQEADNYLDDVVDTYIKDEFAGKDVNKGLDRVNKKYYNPKLDKIRQQRLSTRKVRSDKGKQRKFLGIFGDNTMRNINEFKRGKDKTKRKSRIVGVSSSQAKQLKEMADYMRQNKKTAVIKTGKNKPYQGFNMSQISEFKEGRGKDKKKRKMRKPDLANHIMTGTKYGAGIGGGLGALSGAAYGTLLAPGVGTVLGAGLYGAGGALGGGLQGAAISLPVYAYNNHKYKQQAKSTVKKYNSRQ